MLSSLLAFGQSDAGAGEEEAIKDDKADLCSGFQ